MGIFVVRKGMLSLDVPSIFVRKGMKQSETFGRLDHQSQSSQPTSLEDWKRNIKSASKNKFSASESPARPNTESAHLFASKGFEERQKLHGHGFPHGELIELSSVSGSALKAAFDTG
jgi:hypothetical protein